jgi:polysaccharide pyruvyl transferase WcaK-like protein
MAIISRAAESIGARVRYRLVGWRRTSAGRSESPLGVGSSVAVNTRRLIGLDPAMVRELAKCDLVFDIGEGDSFADIYGLRRFAFVSITKFWALLLGKSLVLSPQTIGPFAHPLARWISNRLLARCAGVFVRDHQSAAYVQNQGVGVRPVEVTDVAFRLPFTRPSEHEASRPLRVGINVSGLLYNGGYTGRNQFGLQVDYPGLVGKLIEHFLGEPDGRVFLVSHVVSPEMAADDDYAISEELGARFPAVQVVPPFVGPTAAKSFIATLDFFVGSRMHACIAAVSAGVPTVALAYSRKFSGLFSSIGYDAVADCTAESEQEVLDRVFQAFADRRHLKDAATRAQAVALERLDRYQQAVAEMLRNCNVQEPRS